MWKISSQKKGSCNYEPFFVITISIFKFNIPLATIAVITPAGILNRTMIETVVSYSNPVPKIFENKKYCVRLNAIALRTLTTATEILSLNAIIKKYITEKEIIPPLRENKNGSENNFALKKPPTKILIILMKKAETYSLFFKKYRVIAFARPIFTKGIGRIMNISSN